MSQKVRILYKNLWRNGTIIARSTEHPQFPAENTGDDDTALSWRSRYGTGSGNGCFVINDGLTVIGSDLISNGGFASNTTGWTPTDCTIESYGYGQSGNCLLLTRTGGSSQKVSQEVSGLIVGKTYWFSAWVKSGSGGDKPFDFFVYDDPVTEILLQLSGTSSSIWTQYSGYFQATTTSVFVYLDRDSGDAGQMAFDTVKLYRTISPNNKIDFGEGGGELTATLTNGTYTGQTLATEIKTQLDAAGALTYTVTYSETTNKFTIAGSSTFSLLWNTGTHKTADASDLLGFSTAADDSGTNTYTGDYWRLNNLEFIDIDLITLLPCDMAALLNHNLQAGAIIMLFSADDSAFTTNVTDDALSHYGNNLFQFLSAVRTKRYYRIYIIDPDNVSGYIKIGTAIAGKYFELTPYISADGYSRGAEDPSVIDLSDSQNLYADEKPKLFTKSFSFKGLVETDANNIIALQEECGTHKAFVVCIDPDNPNTSSYWVTLADLNPVEYDHVNYWNWTMNIREHK